MPREVTVREYRRCVRAGRCKPPEGRQRPELPVTDVTLAEAAAYCAFIGARLPTDIEWSAAARAAGRRFPWGDDPYGGHSNCISSERGRPLRAPGSKPDDRIGDVYDLHANALEWTADGTVRGALYCSEPLATTQPSPAAGHSPQLGFRCVAPGNT
jgi:formylglycine-generating enzyme required for sulfatase activity